MEKKACANWQIALIIVALAVASVAFWRTEVATDIATATNIWINGDLFLQYYPMREMIFHRLRAGEVPLWNPYQACGVPLLATFQTGTFYPLNVVHLFMPVDHALSLMYVVHFFLCGLFMLVYCKSRGTSAVGAAVGAVTYMFCGMTINCIYCPQRLFAMALLPVAFLCVERMIDKRHLSWAMLFGIVLAAQMLTGRERVFVLTAEMAGLLLILELLFQWRRQRRFMEIVKPLLLFVLALALMSALSAIQVLPTNELRNLGWRARLTFEEAAFQPAINLHTLLKEMVTVPKDSWFPVLTFCGILAPVLVPFAFWSKQGRRRVWFYAILGFLGLLLAAGTRTPLYRIYYSIMPFGKIFRGPDRFIEMVSFVIASLSAAGFDSAMSFQISRRDGFFRGVLTRLIPFLLVIAVGLYANAYSRNFLFPILILLVLVRAVDSSSVQRLVERRFARHGKPILGGMQLLFGALLLLVGGRSLWSGYKNYFEFSSATPKGVVIPRQFAEFIRMCQDHEMSDGLHRFSFFSSDVRACTGAV